MSATPSARCGVGDPSGPAVGSHEGTMDAGSILALGLISAAAALILARRGRRGSNAPAAPRPITRVSARPRRMSNEVPGDTSTRELQATVPHLLSLYKLEPVPDSLPVPMAEDTRAASADLRSWLREVSGRAGRRGEMLHEVQRAGWDPKALADLVQSDPLLAGSVLQIINSGYYGLRQRAASVLQAVLLLGVVEVRNLIWRACMSETLRLDRHPARPVIESIWTHSFSASRMAYAMARKARHPRADEVATAALLHDVGKIVFLVAETDGARGLYDSMPYSDDTRLRHEIAEFGITHARASAMLAESWGLPGKTIATIALHHAPTYQEVRSLEGPVADIAIVHAADVLAHLDPRGRVGDDAPPRPRPGWLEALNLGLDEHRMSSTMMTRPLPHPPSGEARRDAA